MILKVMARVRVMAKVMAKVMAGLKGMASRKYGEGISEGEV